MKFILCLVVLYTGIYSSTPATASTEGTDSEQGFSAEVEQVLTNKRKQLEQMLTAEEVRTAVRDANLRTEKIAIEEIVQLDKQWRASKGLSDFIRPFLVNPCARLLRQFRDENIGFEEISISDQKGLNVCQTNKTSDYFQADEIWWQKSFADGRGQAMHGALEYDDSAKIEAIAIVVPVKDPGTGRALGVCKAVIDVTSIKDAL